MTRTRSVDEACAWLRARVSASGVSGVRAEVTRVG